MECYLFYLTTVHITHVVPGIIIIVGLPEWLPVAFPALVLVVDE